MTRSLSSPAHYATGKVQPIDLIESSGHGPGFGRGSAIKYLARAGKKGDALAELRDLLKALDYTAREVSRAAGDLAAVHPDAVANMLAEYGEIARAATPALAHHRATASDDRVEISLAGLLQLASSRMYTAGALAAANGRTTPQSLKAYERARHLGTWSAEAAEMAREIRESRALDAVFVPRPLDASAFTRTAAGDATGKP